MVARSAVRSVTVGVVWTRCVWFAGVVACLRAQTGPWVCGRWDRWAPDVARSLSCARPLKRWGAGALRQDERSRRRRDMVEGYFEGFCFGSLRGGEDFLSSSVVPRA